MGNNKKYIDKILSFQGLRGFAIILIMLSHCYFISNSYNQNALIYFGAYGVELFIVLSGYLAYYNYLLGKRNSSIIRKVKKFFPLHIVTFLWSLPLSLYVFTNGEYLKAIVKIITNLLLINAWIPKADFYFSFNSVSWYLTLVIFFIVIKPRMFKKLEQINIKILITLMMAIILVEFIWTYIFGDNEFSHWLIYICPLIRCLDYLLGAIVFRIVQNVRLKHWQMTTTMIFSLVLSITLLYSSLNVNNALYLTFIWAIPSILLIGVLALGNSTQKINKWVFENPMVVFIGNISFELFLLHQLVIRYVETICSKVGLDRNVAIYVVAIIVAIIISYSWQKIGNQLKNKRK